MPERLQAVKRFKDFFKIQKYTFSCIMLLNLFRHQYHHYGWRKSSRDTLPKNHSEHINKVNTNLNKKHSFVNFFYKGAVRAEPPPGAGKSTRFAPNSWVNRRLRRPVAENFMVLHENPELCSGFAARLVEPPALFFSPSFFVFNFMTTF